MLVPPSTASVHVQGEMGKDPVAEASKRVEAEKKAVQERLTAVQASRDSYVATKVSGEDVVQLMMFRDDETARFDEELAKLEKEGLEVQRKGLEMEKTVVQERLTAMKASRDSYVATKVSGEDVVQLMMFRDDETARFDEELAKLEKEGLEVQRKGLEMEKTVVQERLTAMKASRDSYVATKVSGEDVVQLMMFRDDETARFDEELAKLEKEGLEVQRKGLEMEKTVVQERLTAMKASRDSYVATKVSGEDVVQLMMFKDDVTARFDEELAKLEQSLKSIDVQQEKLQSIYGELVGQVGQAQQQQSTKGPNGFKFTAKVLNGLNAKNLRKNITTSARKCLAFGGHIRYLAPPSFVRGCSLVLEIELYFKLEHQADKFHASLRDCVGRYRRDILRVADVVITPETHSFDPAHQITEETYKPGDSPCRGGDTDIVLPSDSDETTTELAEEVVEQESLVDRRYYDPARGPEWCHIKESRFCSPSEAKDEANRLVMHFGLHQLYDGYDTHDDRCPPGMSVYIHHSDQPTGDYEDGEYQPVTVRVIFSVESVANSDHIYLRNCLKLHDRVFQCAIHKKYPSQFASYLNTRHVSNVERNLYLRDPTDDLVLPQGTLGHPPP